MRRNSAARPLQPRPWLVRITRASLRGKKSPARWKNRPFLLRDDPRETHRRPRHLQGFGHSRERFRGKAPMAPNLGSRYGFVVVSRGIAKWTNPFRLQP